MKIDYNLLKSEDLIQHVYKVLGDTSNEKLTYFIERKTNQINLDRYVYAKSISSWYRINDGIKINSVGHSKDDIKQIRTIFNQLDPIIDLDFEEMSNNNGSMIDIYSVNYSSSFTQKNIVGQVISQENNSGSWFDILWKDTNNKQTISSADNNTIIHEIGHSLGLSHPNNEPENEKWSTDDTVMSYNKGVKDWPNWFTKNDINALKHIWGRENDNGNMNFERNSSDYNYKKTQNNNYYINTNTGFEDITNLKTLSFNDQVLELEKDILGVFNQIKGIDHITGKIFRLYNSALNRFPDIEGFKYWIAKNQSGELLYKQTSNCFINSKEYIDSHVFLSNSEFLSSLYSNVLNRDPDAEGFNYWLNQLSNGIENRLDVLMGFSESNEHKAIFIRDTGL